MNQQNLDSAIVQLINACAENRPVALTPIECSSLRASADKVADVLIAEYDTAVRRDRKGSPESARDVLERIIVKLSLEEFGLVRFELQSRVADAVEVGE